MKWRLAGWAPDRTVPGMPFPGRSARWRRVRESAALPAVLLLAIVVVAQLAVPVMRTSATWTATTVNGGNQIGTVSGPAPATDAGSTDLAAGDGHVCVALSDGTAGCWGDGTRGQLGDGTSTSSSALTVVSSLSGVVQVSSGDAHSCARDVEGQVWCWGANDAGQLGDGTTIDRAAPVQVTGLAEVVDIAAGGTFSCAVGVDGDVSCWGVSDQGGVNGSEFAGSTTPVPVSFSAAVQVAAGLGHACVVTVTGDAECVGWGERGQLGGGMFFSSSTPQGSGASGVEVVAGDRHTCAREASGAVSCWGANGSGQLGDASTDDAAIPGAVSSTQDVTSLAAGGLHTCFVEAGGGVSCTGSNSAEQLGQANDGGSPVLASDTPMDVSTPGPAVQVTAGATATCVRIVDGTAECWGDNSSGQLGRDTTGGTDHEAAAVVGPTVDTDRIAVAEAGGYSTCAITPSADLWCWGANQAGQLGDGTTTDRHTPQKVTSLSQVIDVSVDSQTTCAVTIGGEVHCVGDNSMGQLGDGTGTSRATFAPVSGLDGNPIVDVDVGNTHVCALEANGDVWCWGDDTDGQVGNTDTPIDPVWPTPQHVTGVDDVIDVAAGQNHACAVQADATVSCWGSDDYGQLGDGTWGTDEHSPKAVPVSASRTVTADTQTCTAGAGNSYCWGDNYRSQLGLGSSYATDDTVPDPTQNGTAKVIQLAAGYSHTCRTHSDGEVMCAGNNAAGQLGQPGGGWQVQFLSADPPITGAVAVSSGYDHACAAHAGGTMSCWGQNQYGQIGDDTTTDAESATTVSLNALAAPEVVYLWLSNDDAGPRNNDVHVDIDPPSDPADEAEVIEYVYYRDGTEIGRIDAADASYELVDLNRPSGTYTYGVTAVYPDGESTATEDTITTPKPSPASDLTATAVNDDGGPKPNDADLGWTASYASDLDHYSVRRDGTEIATVPAGTTTYLDPDRPAGDHDYTVVAVVTDGSQSDPTAVATASVAYPAAPTNVTAIAVDDNASGGANDLQVSWDANTSDPDLDHFRVETYANSAPAVWSQACTAATPSTTCTDLDLAGDTWHVRVVAVATDGTESTSAEITAPVAPSDVPSLTLAGTGKNKGKNYADLSWTSVSDADEYVVLRDGTPIATVTGTTYRDDNGGAGLSTGGSFTWTVRPQTSAGNAGVQSNQVSHTF